MALSIGEYNVNSYHYCLINICTFYNYYFKLYIKCKDFIKENNKYKLLYNSNIMLENNNNLLWKYNKRKRNIYHWTSIYVIVIAVIFITIGIIFISNTIFDSSNITSKYFNTFLSIIKNSWCPVPLFTNSILYCNFITI